MIPAYPDVPDCCSSDVFCINFAGEVQNINKVKNFIKRKMSEFTRQWQVWCDMSNNIPSVTLSNSVATRTVLAETQNKTRRRKRKRKDLSKAPEQVVDLASSVIIEDENVCEVSIITEVDAKDKIIEIDLLSESEEMPSTTIKEIHNPLEYIPSKMTGKRKALKEKKRNKKFSRHENQDKNDDNSVVILSDDDDNPKPATKLRRKLRPIVIDGSNVAREHGKSSKTFSCKGIELCVEYFLKRGHTQVTAFVPDFRRYGSFKSIPTTDQPILKKLALQQHVVFTPSREVNGKRVTCYDDRFIVELASKTGGVMLSNDNYRDLLGESDEFKKTIEERLLMYCFVGDILMIPDDPLGRRGPRLDEFLSMPEEVENECLASKSVPPRKKYRCRKFNKKSKKM